MKKLFFSALALVAFSSVSMANTIAIENDIKQTVIEESNSQIVAVGSPSACVQYARGVILKAADEYNLDISREGQYFNIMMEFYMAIYEDCLNN